MSDRSGRSEDIDRERMAQVTHQKLANELIAHFLSESLICSFWAKNERLDRKAMSEFPVLLNTCIP